jgi:hypothetical protein
MPVAARLIRFLILLLAAAPASSQTIEITGVPAYGSLGFISGTTSGVDPLLHHVAGFLHIEGSGFWTKPSFLAPTVLIDGAGGWSLDVGTGGLESLDPFATIFCAALLPLSEAPGLVSSAVSLPPLASALDVDCVDRPGRLLSFAGRTWAVKHAPLPVGPGGNVFTDRVEDVFVDSEGLHLRVAFFDDEWWSSEVFMTETLGHGLYLVKTNSRLDVLDEDVTLGVFTWDPHGDETTVPGAVNREIDFEFSRWGNALDPENAQSVVQPYHVPGNLRRYTIPDLSSDAHLTHFFAWAPSYIRFVALLGDHDPAAIPPAAVLDDHRYDHDPAAGRYVPTAGRARLRINLWMNGGAGGPPAPAHGTEVEVVVTDVEFLPEPGTRLAQVCCGALLAWLAARRRVVDGAARSD